MKSIITIVMALITTLGVSARTLIVYYSYTNNIASIVNELQSKIEADILKIEPTEKGLDYAADNYAVGSSQIAAIRNNPDNLDSYPPIDPVNVNLSEYDCIIIGAPLWWSSMAAPLQTFLFKHGGEMVGKNICLIVSSASSGISGVEADARRLIPNGTFIKPSLWIRSAQTQNAGTLLDDWLESINYKHLTSGITGIGQDRSDKYTVYSISGMPLIIDAESTDELAYGIYIVNGKKVIISK